MDKPNDSFKIVDKRRFDESGDLKDSVTELVSEKEQKDSKTQSDQAKKELKKPVEKAPLKLNFALFTQSLIQQAFMALGLIPWPNTGLIDKKLPVAQEMIEILAILQEKTKGNLTMQEEQLLNTAVYELRMAFLQTQNDPLQPNPPTSGLYK